MSDAIIKAVQESQKKADVPTVNIGDTVDVHVRIVEGTKERIQIFQGVVIGMNGSGLDRTVTVRRIVANEGVERIFPLHSPRVAKIELKRGGHVRRSKLYFLRDRVGKKRRLSDRRRGLGDAAATKQAAKTKKAAKQSKEQAVSPEHAQAEAAPTEPVQDEAGRKE